MTQVDKKKQEIAHGVLSQVLSELDEKLIKYRLSAIHQKGTKVTKVKLAVKG